MNTFKVTIFICWMCISGIIRASYVLRGTRKSYTRVDVLWSVRKRAVENKDFVSNIELNIDIS
jgi:hypothetical protein